MKTRKFAIAFAAALLSLQGLSSANADEDVAAGKAKAAVCAACHGPAGVSFNPIWPNLAGQKKEYIKKQLHAFKDGSRKDPLMSPVAQQLSEDDIQNVAAHFSSLKSE